MSNNSLQPPWLRSPAHNKRLAKLSRLKRKGLLPPSEKAAARQMCNEAVASRSDEGEV